MRPLLDEFVLRTQRLERPLLFSLYGFLTNIREKRKGQRNLIGQESIQEKKSVAAHQSLFFSLHFIGINRLAAAPILMPNKMYWKRIKWLVTEWQQNGPREVIPTGSVDCLGPILVTQSFSFFFSFGSKLLVHLFGSIKRKVKKEKTRNAPVAGSHRKATIVVTITFLCIQLTSATRTNFFSVFFWARMSKSLCIAWPKKKTRKGSLWRNLRMHAPRHFLSLTTTAKKNKETAVVWVRELKMGGKVPSFFLLIDWPMHKGTSVTPLCMPVILKKKE